MKGRRLWKKGQYIHSIGGQGQGPNEFGRSIYISQGSGKNVFILDPINQRVAVLNTDGSLDFKFGRLYTPVPYKPGRKPGQSDEAGIFNAYTQRWLFDGEGNIWIQFFMGVDPENFVYDVFSSDGIYLKQVLVKHRIFQFFEGKAFCLVRDEDGFVAAKRFLLVEKN